MTENTENKISEHIELLTELMKVTSNVKDNVTSDYTLAYLNKDERDYITENYQNGEFAKEIITKFAEKGYYYEFDEKKGDWIRDVDGEVKKIPIKDADKKKLKAMSERLFTFFMVSSHMIAILNRNKDNNFLAKLLAKSQEEEKPVTFDSDDRSILQKIKDKMSGTEQYEED